MSRFIRRQRLGAIPAEASPALPRNTVLHGDCIDVMAGFPEASVDFILTDPPYLCRYRDRAGRTVANDDNPAWLRPAFAEAFRVLREDALCVSFYGWHEVDRFMDAWRAAGFRPVAHLVFAKPYASSARFAEARHECAYVLAKGRPPLPAHPLPDVLPWRYTGNKLHPTEKPVPVLKSLVTAFCPAGGLILDPFCGSGSSLVAARACGREFIGVEMDANHHAVAAERLSRLVGGSGFSPD